MYRILKYCHSSYYYWAVFVGVSIFFTFAISSSRAQTTRVALTPQDFEYIGMLRVPAEISPFAMGGLTFRKVAGQLRFFLTGHPYDDHPVFEMDAPGFGSTLATAPRATVIQNWGAPYRKYGGNPEAQYWLHDLEWFNNLLYWVYGDSYNAGSTNYDPSIGVSDINTAITGIFGPWRTEDHSQRTRGYVTTIPQWFADRYLNGYRLGVGSGLSSGNISSSWGPGLLAIPAPTASLPTSTIVDSIPLVMHPLADVETLGLQTPNHRSRREPTYTADIYPGAPDIPVSGGVGYWTQNDFISGAVWIDLPDKHGVLFLGALSQGQVWYGVDEFRAYQAGEPPDPTAPRDPCSPGTTGPHSERLAQRWWLYDPMSFVPVIQGTAPPWSPRPTAVFDPATIIPAASRDYGECGTYNAPPAATFDPETRTLYVLMPEGDPEPFGSMGYLPVIHAFRVKSGDLPNSPTGTFGQHL